MTIPLPEGPSGPHRDAKRLGGLAARFAAAVERVRAANRRIAGNADVQTNALREMHATAQSAARELGETIAVVGTARTDVGGAQEAVVSADDQIARLSNAVGELASSSRAGLEAIQGLLEVVERITTMVSYVEDVSERTNLLALNAAIEAARAGEHGRGFAVVATEVRKLADSTRSTTREMNALLAEIRQRADATRDVAVRSDEAVKASSTAADAGTLALQAISGAVAGVLGALDHVDRAMQAQAARSEELGRTAESLLTTARAHQSDAAESDLSGGVLDFHTAELSAAVAPNAIARRTGMLRAATILMGSPAAEALERFRALVAERTGGAVHVELDIPYRGKGKGETQALLDLASGELDLASVGCPVASNVLPDAQLFGLPFLFDSPRHAFAVLDGPFGREVLEQAAGAGLAAFGYCENGMRHFSNALRPIRRPDDLRGMRLRVQQAAVYLYLADALGAFAKPIPYVRLHEALRNGEADGQENPLTNTRASKLDDVQRYLTLSAHSYDPQIVLGNAESFERLGERRGIVEGALSEALAWHRARAREMERDALAYLRSRMEVNELTPEERRAFVEAARPVYDRLAALVGERRIAALRAAAEAVPAAAR
ncbi:MAG TPA: DctP family TRAP transporter solute-binding subunit [Candidatus Dormibacteraeota bacterium]|nr:DctP family TRAP transporter solute-binding subunit [Candidatus Dormibacteraeota bacterium]